MIAARMTTGEDLWAQWSIIGGFRAGPSGEQTAENSFILNKGLVDIKRIYRLGAMDQSHR